MAGDDRGFTRLATVPSMFTEEELERFVQLADEHAQAATISGSVQDNEIRRSSVVWLRRGEGYQWVHDRLGTIVQQLNQSTFHFDISGFDGGIQLARYDQSDEGFYTWHMDAGEKNNGRKISISVQISGSEDYEGGNLELFYKSRPYIADRTRGAVVAFPSWVMHRVTPVTRGTRYSLVGWVAGPRWQ